MNRSFYGAAVALAVLAVAGTSQAQVISNVSVTTTNADPTTSVVFGNGQPCATGNSLAHNFATVQVNVSASGTYQTTDLGPFDGGYGIYNGPVNPADLTQNCLASADGGGSWNLTAGTYTFVGGPWINSPNGTYTLELNGPGTVTVGALPASVPTMSEWAMLVMGVLLAGGAALYVQRRQFTAS